MDLGYFSSTENMAYGPPKYGIQTPPFMPYEPFLLGVGVVFHLLTFFPAEEKKTQFSWGTSQETAGNRRRVSGRGNKNYLPPP